MEAILRPERLGYVLEFCKVKLSNHNQNTPLLSYNASEHTKITLKCLRSSTATRGLTIRRNNLLLLTGRGDQVM